MVATPAWPCLWLAASVPSLVMPSPSRSSSTRQAFPGPGELPCSTPRAPRSCGSAGRPRRRAPRRPRGRRPRLRKQRGRKPQGRMPRGWRPRVRRGQWRTWSPRQPRWQPLPHRRRPLLCAWGVEGGQSGQSRRRDQSLWCSSRPHRKSRRSRRSRRRLCPAQRMQRASHRGEARPQRSCGAGQPALRRAGGHWPRAVARLLPCGAGQFNPPARSSSSGGDRQPGTQGAGKQSGESRFTFEPKAAVEPTAMPLRPGSTGRRQRQALRRPSGRRPPGRRPPGRRPPRWRPPGRRPRPACSRCRRPQAVLRCRRTSRRSISTRSRTSQSPRLAWRRLWALARPCLPALLLLHLESRPRRERHRPPP
mmetsp:Transcript_43908/g.126956  ORF Transcript_43908/g.126956 Transcript_43908/m.126956 type:complete len:364 (+) Transcript_43908:39-1130(+)